MAKTTNAKILIVDDQAAIRSAFHSILEMEPYDLYAAEDGVACLELCKTMQFDVIFLDVNMPRMDGLETLRNLRVLAPDTSVVMISGAGDIQVAVDAVRMGALDFISKPPDLDRILILIRNAIDKTTLAIENKAIKRKLKEVTHTRQIIGKSASIMEVLHKIELAAKHDQAKVLILGPNGAGKELVARWIHEKSQRADRPFVEVNCAAIPDTLIDSHLFGHKKGAFTDAKADHKGFFEQAHGGTIFLDEIGDMSMDAQAKVLRALETNKITPVGSDAKQAVEVDVRVVAATNKDLLQAIRDKTFRIDLYHRICVVPIVVPPLNQRRDDIPILLAHYMDKISEEYGKAPKTFSDAALELLTDLDWTGNIRQLRNVVERLIIMCQNSVVTDADIRRNVPEISNIEHHHELFSQFDNLTDLQDYIATEFKKFMRTRQTGVVA